MVVHVPVPLEYELSLLLIEQENACLDKKNPCSGNNQGPNDLSSHKSSKKKPRFLTQKSHHQPRSNLIQSSLPLTPNRNQLEFPKNFLLTTTDCFLVVQEIRHEPR
jgi:hypothetical protein